MKGCTIVKKIILFLMILVMTSSFIACSQTEKDSNNDSESSVAPDLSSDPSNTPAVEVDPLADFEWENTEGGIAITKYLGNSASVTVPEVIENKLVVSIGDTFDGNVVLQELTLPEGVKSADLADCSKLKKLTSYTEELLGYLPENLEELHMPNAKGFPFYNPKFYMGECTLPKNNNLKVLNIPSAIGVAEVDAPNLKKVTMGQMVNCFYYTFHQESSRYALSVDDNVFVPKNVSYEISVDHKRVKEVLTEENKGKYYCAIFGTDSIEVNGKTYQAE